MNTSSKPDIVIMMMTYNHEWSLSETLESLLAQTYKNFHLIIVDDDSRDRSYEIACSYRNRFSSCSVYKNEKNMGAMGNCHYTMKIVEKEAPYAEFFLWACPDDTWSEDFLERTRAEMLRDPDIISCQSYFDMRNIKEEFTSRRCLESLSANGYSKARKIFYPVKSDEGLAYYNNMIHGLIKKKDLTHIFPRDRKTLVAVLCTEISMMALMLLRGQFHVIPDYLFHKKTSGSFVDVNPLDELTLRRENIFARIEAVIRCFPVLWRARAKDRPRSMVIFLWLHLFYYYVVLYLAHRAASWLKKISGSS